MADVYTSFNLLATPQSKQALSTQVKNSAGGFVFKVDPWQQLERFLVLGTEGGTYYAKDHELTKDSATNLLRCLDEDHVRALDLICTISCSGRAKKQNPCIFALAAASGAESGERRKRALSKLPVVCRTATHLFQFIKYVRQFRGIGRGLRDALANWYLSKELEPLGYQVVKYRNRAGCTHRDVLRIAHPKANNVSYRNLFSYICGNEYEFGLLPNAVIGYEKAQQCTGVDIIPVISEYNLPWESVPLRLLDRAYTWEALLANGMPMTALIRQLPKLAAVGVTQKQNVENVLKIIEQITDRSRLKSARVHPISILLAVLGYKAGKNRNMTWTPNSDILEALEKAFYMAFDFVEPTNKRTMLALDVSGSMGWASTGMGISCRELSAAMAMTTLRTEPVGFCNIYGFCHHFMDLPIHRSMTLEGVVQEISDLPFSNTDCALPMVIAKEREMEIDTFVIYTDNETWAGKIHPYQALRAYRKASGIDARLVVCAFTPTEFSIADPGDPGMLDVVGADSSLPELIASFSRREF